MLEKQVFQEFVEQVDSLPPPVDTVEKPARAHWTGSPRTDADEQCELSGIALLQ
jgi:hypothetical protein